MKTLSFLCAAAALSLTTQAVGQGFAAATTWNNPAGGYLAPASDVGFYIPASTLSYSTITLTGSQNWATMDLTGDGRPDLVVTSELAASEVTYPFGTAPNRY